MTTRAHRKAQQKMQSALESGNSTKISDAGSCSRTRKALEQNKCKAALKEPEVSNVITRNSDDRYLVFTLVTVEHDSNVKFVVPLLLQYPDQGNQSGSNANVDTPVLARPSLQSDAPKEQKNRRLDRACSANSLTNRLFGSNGLGPSKNKGLVNRKGKYSEDSESSSQQNSLVSSNSSTSIDDKSDATLADDLVKDLTSEEKPTKKRSRKKSKKKGKSKKPSSSTRSSGQNFLCEEGICEAPLSEAASKKNMVWEEASASYNKFTGKGLLPEVSLEDNMVDGNNVKDVDNCIDKRSSLPMIVSSYSYETEASEATLLSAPLNWEGGDLIRSSANATGKVPAIFEQEVVDIHTKDGDDSEYVSCEEFSDGNNGPKLDPSLGGLSSDVITSSGGDTEEQSTVQEDGGLDLAEKNGDSMYSTWLNGFEKESLCQGYSSKGGMDAVSERTECSTLDNSSSELDLFEPVKRRRRGRKLYGTSSCAQSFSLGGPTNQNMRKENNSSVCQKVCPDNPCSVGSRYDIASTNVNESKGGYKPKFKGFEKMTRKPWLRWEQENMNLRKGPNASQTNSKTGTKAGVISSPVNHCKGFLIGSNSHCCNDLPRVGHNHISRVDFCPSESVENSHGCLDETNPAGNDHMKPCDFTNQAAENPNVLSSESVQSQLVEVPSHGEREELSVSNGPVKLQSQVCKKRDYSSGVENWMSVLRKNVAVENSNGSDNLLTSDLDGSTSDGWSLKNTVEEELSSIPSTIVLEAPSGVSSEDVSGQPTDDEGHAENLKTVCVSEKNSDTFAVANCSSIPLSKNHGSTVNECESNKMAQAVKNAYLTQLASEGIQLATGSPLANFERLLNSTCPVLAETRNLLQCHSCSRDQFIGTSLCKHVMPKISLENLWKWYETHGNYGLEVKAEDCRSSKRMGILYFEFYAYFVPYLSAVQLFGSSRRHSHNTSDGFVSVTIASEPSSSHAKACLDDPELLFEYFESDQPQKRRPLFEQIKALVRGEAPLNGQAYGDPAILDSLDLHALHPASWYAVAWYPIYKIPEGKFRAAFLTYHSLGHLIRRSTSLGCFSGDASIVSPVVGLQSYNDQGECWFNLRQNLTINSEETPNYNPLQLLIDRVRKLEQTASVMARGVVSKGNSRCVNRQPDYEFFVTRKRYRAYSC